MDSSVFYALSTANAALERATSVLSQQGFSFADTLNTDITHLLLPVPSLDSPHFIKGKIPLESILNSLSPETVIIGGNLHTPLLADYRTIDLLKDSVYLWKNAAITAECTLRVIFSHFSSTIHGSSVLILGWGRIGKHLANLLKSLGAYVTVAARKEVDRAALLSLGFHVITYEHLADHLSEFQLILNTVPSPVITQSHQCYVNSDAVLIELASSPGILHDRVIQARGLPGKLAPDASGNLIAESILRLLKSKRS